MVIIVVLASLLERMSDDGGTMVVKVVLFVMAVTEENKDPCRNVMGLVGGESTVVV